MLVAFLRLLGEWARDSLLVAFMFVLGDAVGFAWLHDRPGLRLALVFGIALVGVAVKELTHFANARLERPS